MVMVLEAGDYEVHVMARSVNVLVCASGMGGDLLPPARWATLDEPSEHEPPPGLRASVSRF